MYFTKMFGSALDPNRRDPRDKLFAEFKCSLCNATTDLDITSTRHTFDFARERRCPKCGHINASDRAVNLKAQMTKLLSDKSRIEVEIEKIERELNEFSIQTSSAERATNNNK